MEQYDQRCSTCLVHWQLLQISRAGWLNFHSHLWKYRHRYADTPTRYNTRADGVRDSSVRNGQPDAKRSISYSAPRIIQNYQSNIGNVHHAAGVNQRLFNTKMRFAYPMLNKSTIASIHLTISYFNRFSDNSKFTRYNDYQALWIWSFHLYTSSDDCARGEGSWLWICFCGRLRRRP